MTDPEAGGEAPVHREPEGLLAWVQSTVTFYRAFYRVPWYGRRRDGTPAGTKSAKSHVTGTIWDGRGRRGVGRSS